ncbi:MAG: hypothetical protein J5968_03330 [Oscillospiraceae bacterium]|nr:hypothetical protein [Oscillospiraceae bacterium]MBP1577307.1 hypothetical protein [Oscillospiraceae bacterium]
MANNRNPLLDFASSFLISYGVSKATTEAIRQHDYEKQQLELERQQREAERQRRERQQEVKKIVRETAAAKNRLNAAPEKAAPQPQPKTNPILDVIKAEKRAYAKECFERAQRERNNTNK